MTEDPFAPPPVGARPAPAPLPAYGEPLHTGSSGAGNGFGVAALVLGVLSLLGVVTVLLGLVLGVLAIVFGFLGRARARRGEADNGGMALAGILTGIVALVLSVGIVIGAVVFLRSDSGKELRHCLQNARGNSTATTACQDRFRQDVTGR